MVRMTCLYLIIIIIIYVRHRCRNQQRRRIDFAISLFRDNNTPLIFRPIVNHIIIIHAKNASRKIRNFNDLCKLFFTQVYLWTSRRAPRFIG
jgi:hypothetical protein